MGISSFGTKTSPIIACETTVIKPFMSYKSRDYFVLFPRPQDQCLGDGLGLCNVERLSPPAERRYIVGTSTFSTRARTWTAVLKEPIRLSALGNKNKVKEANARSSYRDDPREREQWLIFM